MAKTNPKKRRLRPTTSPYCKPGGSKIHQQGLFATKKIPEDAEIIPYVGEKVSKAEGDKRAIDLADERLGTGDASVYMFILDDDYDIDGNVPHNTARLINHSCDPNCEAQIIDDEIWIVSLRAIPKGAEITFDYGFDLDHYEEHPCRCGSANCVGYIVSKDYWPKLARKLAAKKKAAAKKKKKATSPTRTKKVKKKSNAKKAPPSKKKTRPAKKTEAAKKKSGASKKKVVGKKRSPSKKVSPGKKGKKAARKKK